MPIETEADAKQVTMRWTESQEKLFQQLLKSIARSLAGESGPSFTYLIGNNGTGKSQQLASVANHFATPTTGGPDVVACISNAVYDRFTLGTRGRIEYLGARTSGNAVFHTAIDRQVSKIILKGLVHGRKSIQLLEKTLDMTFSFAIGGSDSALERKQLDKLVDRRKLKGETMSRFLTPEERKLLVGLLARELKFSRLKRAEISALRKLLDLNPDVKIWVVKAGQSDRIDFNQLSTGEQNRALTYAKILSVAGRNSLILIDEPEISLHLHWQMTFHRSIVELLSTFKNFHVVIATHSPLIISEGAKSHPTTNAAVIVLEATASAGKGIGLEVRSQSFKEISSHERLVLDQFDTATYRTPVVDFEIAEAVLEAAEAPDSVADVESRLGALFNKEGLTAEDKRHIGMAMKVVRQTLTH